MYWDVPHRRGAGFPLAILRPVGVWSILSDLYEHMHLSPSGLMALLRAANVADAPLVGLRNLPGDLTDVLTGMVEAELIKRCVGGQHGGHTRYDITPLGAGLVEATLPLAAWAMADWDFVVAATRVRLGLPALDGAVPRPARPVRPATGMAISLLSGQWSSPVMMYVDSAGRGGIGPQQLRDAVNADLSASWGESRVGRRLHQNSLYQTLARLVAKGLLVHVEDPPRVRYLLSPHGRGLMRAWWQVADGWGIEHDKELFRIVARQTSWFPDAPRT